MVSAYQCAKAPETYYTYNLMLKWVMNIQGYVVKNYVSSGLVIDFPPVLFMPIVWLRNAEVVNDDYCVIITPYRDLDYLANEFVRLYTDALVARVREVQVKHAIVPTGPVTASGAKKRLDEVFSALLQALGAWRVI